MDRDGVVQYLGGDHRGTTSLVLNANGTVHSEARHYPYGEERWSSGTLPTDYRFTGQRNDSYIKLVHMGARFYDSALGRWISADTLVPEPGSSQSYNRYAYVRNSPLKFVDPTGHADWVGEGEGGVIWIPWTPPIGPVGPYNPQASTQQAAKLVIDWFLEQGDDVRYFGPDNSLTQDIMFDPGMVESREKWAEQGYSLPFVWSHTVDQRTDQPSLEGVKDAMPAFVREQIVELGLSILGLGSQTPEGQIDAVGGTIGSLDMVIALDVGNNNVMFVVYNSMDWQSATRLPGSSWGLPPVPRWFPGPGGQMEMFFFWWEKKPSD